GACVGFFFSSRRRHTRLVSDWSSDVCSSDLLRHLHRDGDESLGPRFVAVTVKVTEPPSDGVVVSAVFWRATSAAAAALIVAAPEIGRASCRGRVGSWGGDGRVERKQGDGSGG